MYIHNLFMVIDTHTHNIIYHDMNFAK